MDKVPPASDFVWDDAVGRFVQIAAHPDACRYCGAVFSIARAYHEQHCELRPVGQEPPNA